MSAGPVIVIIGNNPPRPGRVVETAEGAEIQQDGQSVATFTGPNAYDNAIKYLKVMKG
jgi:hypothetical protein